MRTTPYYHVKLTQLTVPPQSHVVEYEPEAIKPGPLNQKSQTSGRALHGFLKTIIKNQTYEGSIENLDSKCSAKTSLMSEDSISISTKYQEYPAFNGVITIKSDGSLSAGQTLSVGFKDASLALNSLSIAIPEIAYAPDCAW